MFDDETPSSARKFTKNNGDNFAMYRHQTTGHAYVTGATNIITGAEVCPIPLVLGAAGGGLPDQAAVDARDATIKDWTARNRKMYEYFLYTQGPNCVGYITDIAPGDCVATWAAIQRQYLTGTRAGALQTVFNVTHTHQKTTTILFVHELRERRRELTSVQAAIDATIAANAVAAAAAVAAGAPVPIPAPVQNMGDLLATSALLQGLPKAFAVTVDRLSSLPD